LKIYIHKIHLTINNNLQKYKDFYSPIYTYKHFIHATGREHIALLIIDLKGCWCNFYKFF